MKKKIKRVIGENIFLDDNGTVVPVTNPAIFFDENQTKLQGELWSSEAVARLILTLPLDCVCLLRSI